LIKKLIILFSFVFLIHGIIFSIDHPLNIRPIDLLIYRNNILLLKGEGLFKYDDGGNYRNIINKNVINLKVDLDRGIIFWQDIEIHNGVPSINSKKIGDNLKTELFNYFRVNNNIGFIADKIFYPQRIALGPDELIYAIGRNYYNNRGIIGAIDPDDGHTIAMYQILSSEEAKSFRPNDIAVDGDGNIYITGFKDAPIKKFTKDGKFIMNIGGWGNGKGEFVQPYAIAVDKRNNDIFVTDVFAPSVKQMKKPNLCVQRFDKNGKFIKRWGGEWVKVNSLFPPNITFVNSNIIEFAYAITVDSKGYVYVLEKFGPRISKYDNNGRLKKRWGKRGSAPGEFDDPEGIIIDRNNNVYVADTGNNRVQKFDSNGNFLMEIR